jgi:uncharacterized protein
MSTDLSHVKTQHLEIECQGQISYLAYEIDSQGWIVLWHTEVPAAQRGRGLAGQLIRKAFEYAEEQQLKVEVICPFATRYVSHHPELKRQVSKRPHGVR